MQDALGLTSDQVYHWRLFLEEYGPTIVYIKGIHNTVVDAISGLDYGPVTNDRTTWMTFTQCWCHYIVEMHDEGKPQATHEESTNLVFANCSKENALYSLTTSRIPVSRHHNGTTQDQTWLFSPAG